MEKSRINLSTPTLTGCELDYVKDALDSGWIAAIGPQVDGFERDVATYVGAQHAAAMSSGTAAIHLSLMACGVGEGDLVFSSALTFSATCNPIVYQRGTPVFIDSEADSWNMSPQALERAFETMPRPKAVIVTNLYGTPAQLDIIRDLCDAHHVPLVEDAAESLGSTWKGQPTGTFGQFGVFSFNGNKIITTSSGGMIVSADGDAIQKMRFWSTQARDPARHYQHSELGYNYRISNICAGVGRAQMTNIDERIAKKAALYAAYKDGFSDIPQITMNPIPPQATVNYWLSCFTIAPGCPVTPTQVLEALEEDNIEGRPIWKPMNLQPYYEKYAFFPHEEGSVPVGDDIFARGLCLPSDIKMTPDDLDRVIGIVRRLFGKS